MRNIFLIGLSDSGKSAVGHLLAEQLGRPLFDIDTLIEKEYNERIVTLLASKGEAYVRACESRVLVQTIQEAEKTGAGAIIATSSGSVQRAANRQRMVEHGIRVSLSLEPEEAEIICATSGKSVEIIVRELIATLIGMGEFADDKPVTQHAHVGNGYDVIVAWGGLGQLAHYLNQLKLPPRIFVITDSNIQHLYAPSLLSSLTSAGYEPLLYAIPAGEASKSQEQLNAIYTWLLEQRAERREAIVALGGGVVGDLVGFVAATYLRGVPLIQVPTSLLAQVDAAIGGKTGINHARGKNLIGAFYHPRLVLADPATLLTLPERERTEGWAEVVKYGIILDAELITQLEEHAALLRDFRHPPATLLCQIIARCIGLKVAVIEEDEREQGLRAILNYGHTVAHALENVAGYGTWLHGEAVSLGMVVAAEIAVRAGMFSVDEMERQNRLLQALGLPLSSDGTIQAEAILAAMPLDKKVAGKRIHWILPQQIGKVKILPLPDEQMRPIVEAFFTRQGD